MAEPFKVRIANTDVELVFDMAALDWFEGQRGHGFIEALVNHLGSRTTTLMLLAGMRALRGKMEYKDSQALIQAHLDQGGTLADVNESITKGLRHFGVLREQEGTASSRPTQTGG